MVGNRKYSCLLADNFQSLYNQQLDLIKVWFDDLISGIVGNHTRQRFSYFNSS